MGLISARLIKIRKNPIILNKLILSIRVKFLLFLNGCSQFCSKVQFYEILQAQGGAALKYKISKEISISTPHPFFYAKS